MRKTINILWLEDDLQSTAHKNRTKIVGDILKKKGYEANIIPKGTFEEAKEALKKDVSSYFNLPETSNFVFANFTFFSVGRNRLVQKNFEEAIDVILSRWDELNALRGEYMYENAELEYLLRNKCPDYPEDKPYRELVKNYFIHELKLNNDLKRRNIERYKFLNHIKENWLMLIDRRNALAHVIEDHEPEKGYFIQSNNENCEETFIIYERNLDEERCNLLEVVAMIKELLV